MNNLVMNTSQFAIHNNAKMFGIAKWQIKDLYGVPGVSEIHLISENTNLSATFQFIGHSVNLKADKYEFKESLNAKGLKGWYIVVFDEQSEMDEYSEWSR